MDEVVKYFLISEQTLQKDQKIFFDIFFTHLTILFHPLHEQSSLYFSTSLQGRQPSILGENRPLRFFPQSVLPTGIEQCGRFCIPPFLRKTNKMHTLIIRMRKTFCFSIAEKKQLTIFVCYPLACYCFDSAVKFSLRFGLKIHHQPSSWE